MNGRKRIAHVSFTSVLGFLVMNAALATSCVDSQHRAFNFWIGEWQVETPDGMLAGVNRIEREYEGCVLHEHYDTGRGYSGERLNVYDSGRKRVAPNLGRHLW